MIRLEVRDQTAILKLNRSTTNALNLELVNQLAENLQRVKDGSNIRGLVFGSSNYKFFSIGFDIPQLIGLDRKDFVVYYQAYNRVCMDLYTLPKPTVAALTGHAIAGGCILALCCDYRFIAEGRKLMGLNEIKLGLPVPYPGDRILRDLVGVRNAREIMSTGEFYGPEELLQMGVVDQVLPSEQVMLKSIEKAKSLGGLPHEAFRMIKNNRVEMVEAEVLSRLKEKEQFFIERWFSDEAREQLREAIKKF
ncbi:MAG: enoyl-CoA hydratase/isomerase family protein [Candidatus Bathyarchaeota archaeon]|nr:MAG: enoyl-CoA hydratase/isomerase family protein [Candidatus Bathyarchaeota archaeon]